VDLVNSYAAALSRHPLAFEAVGETAGEIIEQFDGEHPDLVVCFASAEHSGVFEDVSDGLRKLLEPEVFMGCSAIAVAGGGIEVEREPGLSVFAARFGGGRVTGVMLDAERTDDGFAIAGWPDELPTRGTLLTLADPFTFPMVDFLRLCNAQVPDLQIMGGMASAAAGPGGNRLVLDDRIVTTAGSGTSSEHITPTAPDVKMRSSSAMRLPPGPAAADAIPPMTVSSGTCALQSRRKSSIGNENGSASVSSVPRVGSSSGQPPIETPSSVRSASSTTPATRPPPKRAANTESPGSPSISTPPPATATAVHPMNTSGSSSLRSPPMTSSNAPLCCTDAKHTTRSGRSPSNRSRISPAVSPTAS